MTGSERRTRESLWDAMRAFATVRVVAWHTWQWAPLSWVAAMPAMFFTAGVLLEGSVERHGWVSTVRTRMRRLLIPFWLYAATAVVIMLALGWRPGVGDLWQWVLPLGDPIGSSEAPTLWIPLWYLRAYLWFVLVSGALSWLATRLRWWAVLAVGALALVQQWAWASAPMAVSDGVVYAVFVVAGMVVSSIGVPGRRWLIAASVPAAAATAVAMLTDRASTVVNESYLVTVAAGVATVGVLLLAASPIRRVATGVGAGIVDWLGRRALSVYLWQGLGLFAADRLIIRRGVDGVWGVIGSGVVVAVVTIAMAVVAGPVEDIAAKRQVVLPSLRWVPGLVTAGAVMVAAFVVTPNAGTVATLPLSGRGVVAVGDAMNDPDNTAVVRVDPSATTTSTVPIVVDTVFDADAAAARDRRVITFLDTWAVDHAADFADLDEDWIEMAVATPDGEVAMYRWSSDGGAQRVDSQQPMPWFSNSKAATTGWMMSLVQRGIVRLDDPVGKYLPEVPHGDEITLEHLARHVSGIPSSADSSDPANLDVGADVRRWMRSGELADEPGASMQYSRVGYALLGWALERASGVSWQATIAEMAGEADVDVWTDERDVAADAPNHHPGEGSYRGRLFAAGGLISTPAGMAGFYQWLFTSRLTDASIGEYLSAYSRPETYHYGLGNNLLCPCTDDGTTMRAERLGHGSPSGWWQHDPVHDVTLVFQPENVSADGWFAEVVTGDGVQQAALRAVIGP